jgi:hypothetical protein
MELVREKGSERHERDKKLDFRAPVKNFDIPAPVLDELVRPIDIQVENGLAGQSKKLVTTPRKKKWEMLNAASARSNLGRLEKASKTPK